MKTPKVTITGTLEFIDSEGRNARIIIDKVYIYFPEKAEKIDLKEMSILLDIPGRYKVTIERAEGLWISGILISD